MSGHVPEEILPRALEMLLFEALCRTTSKAEWIELVEQLRRENRIAEHRRLGLLEFIEKHLAS